MQESVVAYPSAWCSDACLDERQTCGNEMPCHSLNQEGELGKEHLFERVHVPGEFLPMRKEMLCEHSCSIHDLGTDDDSNETHFSTRCREAADRGACAV